jgi:hypothetical protein
MTMQDRIERAVAYELARFARAAANIEKAVANGRISAHDGEERIARREQEAENYIAHVRGEKRPTQRQQQPLDDPNAHKVG